MTDTAILTPSIEDLEATLGQAERDLAELDAEHANIGRRTHRAAHQEEGAGEALVEATRRSDDLPALRFAARCQMLRCRIALKSAQRDAFAALVPPLRATAKAARDHLKEAKAASVLAARDATRAESSARALRPVIAHLEDELGGLIAERSQAPGKVVRSVWQG